MGQLKLPVPTASFCRDLLCWYQRHRRDLPWRREPEPYSVFLAEIMLQQTQVKTMLPYYQQFLSRYPTLESLATSDEEEVLALWSGLGYYRRARNLRQAAQQIFNEHKGSFPQKYEDFIKLPGVGRYTAGAVLSIAFGKPLPILDGNIRRVLARYLRLDDESSENNSSELWGLLTRISQCQQVQKRISDFNQALMELGALVCTPRTPSCGRCPLEDSCLGLAAGVQEKLPIPRSRRPVEKFHYAVAVVRFHNQFLLKKNLGNGFLEGFWEFPKILVNARPNDLAPSSLEKTFQKDVSLSLRVHEVLKPIHHQITFRQLTFHPVMGTLQMPTLPEGLFWGSPNSKRSFPVPSYVPKIIKRYHQKERG